MHIGGHGQRLARLALAFAAATSGACASLSSDVHLSPLFSNLSTAGGGSEIEALAGAIVVHRPTPSAEVDHWHLRPLWCHYEGPDNPAYKHMRSEARDSLGYDHFLVPLGDRVVREDERVARMLPVFHWQTDRDDNGQPRSRLIALPGIFWSQDSTGRIVRAWFPFGGIIEDFGTYDRIDFWLWPLFVRSVRGGRTSWHFLYPIFNYVEDTDTGQKSGRIWPLFAVQRQGGYDRRFWLWPFFHYQRDNLNAPPDKQRTRWMFWPFWGEEKVGTFKAWSWLWPFFGYARDPRSGFWSWDGPWPFVRFQRPGTSNTARRSRVWPFYSYFEGDGLTSRWVLWPIFNQREEVYRDGTRRGENVIPFWQHWESYDLDGNAKGSWEKLWPLYQRHVEDDYRRSAFPALNPLWHTPELDEHYAWLWELYTRESQGEVIRERSWGGLWRRERDAGEEREYVSGLWSRRQWREGDGRVRETSLLFGLLRWRSRAGVRFELLSPAFPGPGWPALRHG